MGYADAVHNRPATTKKGHNKPPPKLDLTIPDWQGTPGLGTDTGGGGGDGTKKKKKGAKGTMAGGILGPEWLKLENAYLAAQRTKTLKDDKRALDNEENFLRRLLRQRKLSAQKKNAVLKELLKVDRERLALAKKTKKSHDQLGKEYEAVLETRGTFFSEFAGNIFGMSSGGLTIGGTHGEGQKNVNVNQTNHYNEIPKNRYAHARAMQRAASEAMGGV